MSINRILMVYKGKIIELVDTVGGGTKCILMKDNMCPGCSTSKSHGVRDMCCKAREVLGYETWHWGYLDE